MVNICSHFHDNRCSFHIGSFMGKVQHLEVKRKICGAKVRNRSRAPRHQSADSQTLKIAQWYHQIEQSQTLWRDLIRWQSTKSSNGASQGDRNLELRIREPKYNQKKDQKLWKSALWGIKRCRIDKSFSFWPDLGWSWRLKSGDRGVLRLNR